MEDSDANPQIKLRKVVSTPLNSLTGIPEESKSDSVTYKRKPDDSDIVVPHRRREDSVLTRQKVLESDSMDGCSISDSSVVSEHDVHVEVRVMDSSVSQGRADDNKPL